MILAILLIATLGVQYWLNLQTQYENNRLREYQEKELVSSIALGSSSISSDFRLREIIESPNQPFYAEPFERVQDILIIDEEWQVSDSLQKDYLPRKGADGKTVYFKLKDVKNLPPIVGLEKLGADRVHFPTTDSEADPVKTGETHVVPVETTYGRWYVLVVIKSNANEAFWRAAQPLVYTLAVLLISTLITVLLVWRFTRPIANLSDAARRVAEGDLTVRVPDAKRYDELGQLSARFNEMTAELEKNRELETQLQQAEKSAVVGRLASAIAHEIRNPLNYINLTLDHLRAKFTPEENGQRDVFEKLTFQLKTEVGRINRQITDFLRYSRPLQLNAVPTDIQKVVEDSMRIVEGQAAEQNIKTSIVAREEIPPILGDAEFLRSVFNNLFLNAVQAMPEGGNLSVIISNEENFVRLEIADTGCGIAPENLDKIFEPYFSTKETGTGLGLAIVKKIVDDHDGMIRVESELNKGTRFIVELPQAK